MNVIVLQHVPREGSGAIGDALRARGVDERVIRTDRGDAVPRDLGDAGGLLVMGGPMGVYEADRFPHLRDEMRLIESAIASGLPLLGVCLGSQLVAASLGARVERAARREIGWLEVRLRDAARDDALWTGCTSSFVALHWHGDVFDLPKGAVSLASSGETEHQAYRFGDSVWGVLFHIEMDVAQVGAMADTFHQDLADAGLTRDDIMASAQARVTELAPITARAFGAWADRVAEVSGPAKRTAPSPS